LATAEILSGICGYTTTVEARMDGARCAISIESECEAVRCLAAELTQVNPFQEITFRGEGPLTLRLAAQHCSHAACPVPVGIIKAIEVDAGLALPADITIKVSKSPSPNLAKVQSQFPIQARPRQPAINLRNVSVMSACVFCGILAGELPASVVLEDDLCWAFMDIRPVNPGHVLVVPTHHALSLAELDGESGARMFQIAQRVAQAVRHSGLRCEGINLFLADGQVAGQEVFHVHLHVIPRYKGDGFGLRFGPRYGHRPARMELDVAAAGIQRALG
jgi:histidine triad (HIT) family protein